MLELWEVLQQLDTGTLSTSRKVYLLNICSTDEAMKAAAYMIDAMFDPEYAKSGEPNKTALNLAYKTDLPAFEWFEALGNEQRRSRFGITMDASRRATPPDVTLHGQ